MDLLLNFLFNVISACGLSNFYVDGDIYYTSLHKFAHISFAFSLLGKKIYTLKIKKKILMKNLDEHFVDLEIVEAETFIEHGTYFIYTF